MPYSEGRIYRLKWDSKKGTFRGSVVGHPTLRAIGATFREMEERLCELVADTLQPGEWTAEWHPPAPSEPGARGSVLDSHVALSAEGRFVALQDPREVFTSFCDTCGMADGERTHAPLRAFIENPAHLCADFDTLPGKLTIFSRELAEAILAIGPSSVKFRPVQLLGRGKREFVEPVLRTARSLALPIALRGEPKELGWECPRCGFRFVAHFGSAHPTTTYHRRSDLPLTKPVFWMTDCFGSPEVCVPSGWWRAHRRKSFAKGVASDAVGVANDGDIDPSPKLHPWSAMGRKGSCRRKWLKKQKRLAEVCGVPFIPWKL